MLYLVALLLAAAGVGYLIGYRRPDKPVAVGEPSLGPGLKAEIAALQKDVMDLRVIVQGGRKDISTQQQYALAVNEAVKADMAQIRHVQEHIAALAGQIEKTGKDIAHWLGLEAEAATIRLRRDVEGAAVATAAFVDSAITKLGNQIADVSDKAEHAGRAASVASQHAVAAGEHARALTDLVGDARADVAEIASAPGHVKAAVQEIAALRQRVSKVADEVESEMGLIAKMAVQETAKQAAQAAANIDGLRKRASVVGSGKDPIVVPPVTITYVSKGGRVIGQEIIPSNQRKPTRTYEGKAYAASEQVYADEWIYVRA